MSLGQGIGERVGPSSSSFWEAPLLQPGLGLAAWQSPKGNIQ